MNARRFLLRTRDGEEVGEGVAMTEHGPVVVNTGDLSAVHQVAVQSFDDMIDEDPRGLAIEWIDPE